MRHLVRIPIPAVRYTFSHTFTTWLTSIDVKEVLYPLFFFLFLLFILFLDLKTIFITLRLIISRKMEEIMENLLKNPACAASDKPY